MPGFAQVVRKSDGDAAVASNVPAYEWRDEERAPKAAVVLVHGFTQEALACDALARTLARRQYLVLSMDQRGHGQWYYDKHRSAGAKADFASGIADLDNLCHAVRRQNPGLPLFCIGESCGSALVTQTLARDSELANGIVLCSPGTRPRVYSLYWVVHDFICNGFRLNRQVDIRRYIKRYASNDPRVTDEMLNDPLSRGYMSGHELFGTVAFLYRTQAAAKHVRSDIPLMVVQGSRDQILATSTVPELIKRFKTTDKEILVLPNCGHVLIGTSFVPPAVSDGIVQWLDSQVTVQVSDRSQLAGNSVAVQIQPTRIP
jgi:alpha-beta hydrolase superfamily lysophospholipase